MPQPVSKSSLRLIGIAGIAQILLSYLPIALVPVAPDAGAHAAEVATYYTAHRGALLLVGWLGVLGLIPSFAFSAGLLVLVRRAEGDGAWLWVVTLVGFATTYAAIVLAFGLTMILPYDAAGAPKEVLKVLSDFAALALALVVTTEAGSYIPIALVITRTRFLPIWLGYLVWLIVAVDLLASLALLLDSGPFRAGGVVPLLGLGLEGVFVLGTSVVLIRRSLSPARASA